MNREDIIRMAREVGIEIDIWEPLYEGDSTGFRVCEFTHEELERFTALVAAAERDRMCKQFNIPRELAHEKTKGNEAD